MDMTEEELEDKIEEVVKDLLPDQLLQEPERKRLSDEIKERITSQIQQFEELHEEDPTTGEVADEIGEPRNHTEYWLEKMEQLGEVESYPIGRAQKWRVQDGEDS